MPALDVSYDSKTDTLTVEGVPFAGQFFRLMANSDNDMAGFARAFFDLCSRKADPAPLIIKRDNIVIVEG